ncbi:hypothetical protein K469DRAFT_648334 [Zopfia rhizophila CBS 207.26]|uniref:Uncharacterized protein n=1 Tax=Zopfia rhizophila CBS 207.26 TaxID=1314779 RepID=A0A6A6D8T1_9PEZI|nr:hypothetical protein K469DRAFT_648334 [Zopfia rhizophila CBS 207.26]
MTGCQFVFGAAASAILWRLWAIFPLLLFSCVGWNGFASFWFDTFIPPVTHLAYPISLSGVENDDRQTLVAFLEDGNGVEAVIAKRRSGLIAFPLEVRFSRNCRVIIFRLLGN